jgi:hypothetical protein
MSNKNPFEIRFDTLAMAKEMLDREYETQMQRYYEAMEQARSTNKDVTELFDKYMPKMYTPGEIAKQAEELYKFVTKKD